MSRPEFKLVSESIRSSQENLEAAYWTAEAWPYSISRLRGEFIKKLENQAIKEWGELQWCVEHEDFSGKMSDEDSQCELWFRKKTWQPDYLFGFTCEGKRFNRPNCGVLKPKRASSEPILAALEGLPCSGAKQEWAWWLYLNREIPGIDSLSNLAFLEEARRFAAGFVSVEDLEITSKILSRLTDIKERLDRAGIFEAN